MSSEQVFYITRIVLTSLCHGITLTILAREGGKGHRALITMGTMTLIITALGSFFVFLFPSQASHVSSTAYMMLIVMGIMFCLVSTGSPLTERLFIYITYVAVFMLMVGFSERAWGGDHHVLMGLRPGDTGICVVLSFLYLFSLLESDGAFIPDFSLRYALSHYYQDSPTCNRRGRDGEDTESEPSFGE